MHSCQDLEALRKAAAETLLKAAPISRSFKLSDVPFAQQTSCVEAPEAAVDGSLEQAPTQKWVI